MTSEIAISLQNVTKTFSIREKNHDTIRDRVKGLFTGQLNIRTINALKDVNLDIYKGEFFGIVGHNGSGKSTLLKLIIGAIKADRNSKIVSNGKVLRLALGMGFDMNLSARHNVYVNGSVMGLTFKQIGDKFKEIINFSELWDFIDTPIKYYSSGMVSRLAFAIAMHVEADILLIDEFFGGVGDESFRQKSSEKFKERILAGKTIVMVSHDMNLMSSYCSRVCILNQGKCSAVGIPKDVLPGYLESYRE